MAKVVKKLFFFFIIFLFINFQIISAKALEIIRDTELEEFTSEIINILLSSENFDKEELRIYFINSKQVNAFVTGGKNIFINTELVIDSNNYGEYAAVLAHELAHIIGGHIFISSIEISNLNKKAFPIYLLGIMGIISGADDAGVASVMVGQASVADGFTYYSRTQEAAADQSAVKILCKNGIDAKHLIEFLKQLPDNKLNLNKKNNYRSTHPLVKNRVIWINNAIEGLNDCNFEIDKQFEKRFNLIKAKLHAFTHPYDETAAVYNKKNDNDLYASAVLDYLKGDHSDSINNLEILINRNPNNPFYKELLGEIYFSKNNYEKAVYYQLEAIKELNNKNDIFYMMMGNYLLAFDDLEKQKESISFLKKSIQINPNNAYSWYLLARAYGEMNEIAKANYATAERYYLIGERKLSYNFAQKAIEGIEKNSPEWYRTADLIEILKKEVSKNRE